MALAYLKTHQREAYPACLKCQLMLTVRLIELISTRNGPKMTDITPLPSPNQLPDPSAAINASKIAPPSDGALKLAIVNTGFLGAGFMVLLHLNEGGEVQYRYRSHRVKFRLGRRDRTAEDQRSAEILDRPNLSHGDQDPST
jgi:hypothetical protein